MAIPLLSRFLQLPAGRLCCLGLGSLSLLLAWPASLSSPDLARQLLGLSFVYLSAFLLSGILFRVLGIRK